MFLYAPDGKRYLDLVSGVSVSNVGHGRKEVVEAIQAQAADYTHLMVYGELVERPQVELATLLAAQLPDPMDAVYFVNSGSEAIEAALKLAKRVTGRYGIVAFEKAYHGGTQGSLSVMGDEGFRQAFRPLLPGVTHIPFNEVEALACIDHTTACVLMEPVQGEAGVRVPKPGYLEAVRRKCDEAGALLLFDEVQTGFGRTGKLFAMDTYKVTPDIVSLAKALGGGMPLGAIACSWSLMQAWQSNPVLGHITTFGGHPVCCAAGLASLKLLLTQDWISQADAKGAYVQQEMEAHPQVKEVRRSGLLLAVDLGDAQKVQRMLALLVEEGAMGDLFLFCDTAFRIAPPLCITFDELKLACDIVRRALDRL